MSKPTDGYTSTNYDSACAAVMRGERAKRAGWNEYTHLCIRDRALPSSVYVQIGGESFIGETDVSIIDKLATDWEITR